MQTEATRGPDNTRTEALGWVLLAVYAVFVIAFLSRLSLTLDEILDLLTLRSRDWRMILEAVPRNLGGVPLSYITRWGAISLLGESSFSARLPSVLFSLATCFAVQRLARHFGLRYPAVAVAVIATLPLQFRYAMEARAYSEALCISAWTTVLFFRWLDAPGNWTRGFAYWVLVMLGLYTQPFSLFVPFAHLAWLCLFPNRKASRMPILVGMVLAVAVMAFLPWYLYSARLWADQGRGYGNSIFTLHSILLIFRDISGAGYFGAIVLACGVCMGVYARKDRWFWVLYLLLPILLALIADYRFGYFLAIRQMIFVLVPISFLFVAGVEFVLASSVRWGALLLAVWMAAAIYEDAHTFWRPREDWKMAARSIAERTSQTGCVLFVSPTSDVYAYFEPVLASRECSRDGFSTADLVLVASGPYGDDTDQQRETYRRQLESAGITFSATENVSFTRLEVYRRVR